jgi:methylenetetrahydrofolate reductase (NADPH)
VEETPVMLNILKRPKSETAVGARPLGAFLDGFSIEVMPRTAAKVEDFKALLPAGTRVYIAHIEGTPIEDMVATAKRLHEDDFPVMPHIPARIIKDKATLEDWIKRYQGEAGVVQALLLAGGVDKPYGEFEHSSMQLMETGLFDQVWLQTPACRGPP